MDSLLIVYLSLAAVYLVVDFTCCIIARSPFRIWMIPFALAWPVSWPAIAIMASVMLRSLKDAGFVPESKRVK